MTVYVHVVLQARQQDARSHLAEVWQIEDVPSVTVHELAEGHRAGARWMGQAAADMQRLGADAILDR